MEALTVLHFLSIPAINFSILVPPFPPILRDHILSWKRNYLLPAVRNGHFALVSALISLGCIEDTAAGDGTTAFTCALGTMNTGKL